MSKRKNKTSEVIDKWTTAINNYSPINVTFLTHPINKALNERIRSLETLYEKSSVYRFLIRQGVHPLLLFITVSTSIGYGLQRSYQKSSKLVLQLVGVVYPTYCCWKLLKGNKAAIGSHCNGSSITHTDKNEQLMSWLTYWVIFGAFQVLDHLMLSDLFLLPAKKKYNLYKLFTLYWAQNPHSKGAYLLYKYVIQKPPVHTSKESSSSTLTSSFDREFKQILTESNEDLRAQPTVLAKTEEEKHNELSIYIHRDERPSVNSYRYLDGFEPPNLYSDNRNISNDNSSSSSSSSSSNSTSSVDTIDSASSKQYSTSHSLTAKEEETFSSLVTSAEAAWT
ncbi:hypothetical protein BDF20DRAFT_912528 [Mycotypha africana]|uniref:uncharacterized protein n=1 Tax=Mycotypha africana TaxID=64632 RepID=UPI0022FFDAE3|nr:uncharacterized protein BDF20DRAFT_912528 [Mycotypha africana]KAI8982355.1 hypothetical protein BDF20DRAFT_912528 [Mycotypha africana]